jgi:Trp operon repressor
MTSDNERDVLILKYAALSAGELLKSDTEVARERREIQSELEMSVEEILRRAAILLGVPPSWFP